MRVSLVGLNVGGNPPLGLGHLKAYADADPDLAREVRLNLHGYDFWSAPETVVLDVVRDAPRVVGINVMHGATRKVLRIAEGIKALAPGVTIVLGGVEAGPSAEWVLTQGAAVDLVVTGEGEATFAEILEGVSGGGPLGAIAGTVAREDGSPVRRPERPLLDLANVPSPYLSGALDPDDFDAVHLETYRGCAYRCAFCYEGRGFSGPRLFPEEQVLEELRFVLARSPRPAKFYDTTFNQFRGRTLRILEHLARHNTRGHTFGAEVRMEAFDEELIRAARRAGVLDVETGLQSIREDTLSGLGRTADRGAFEANVRGALRAGLRVIVHVMGALPGDRLSDTLRAHDYVLSLGAEPSLFHTRVLPGTALHEAAGRRAVVFVREPPFDVLRHATFSLADYERYNRFGLARAVLGAALPVVFRIAERTSRPASALIEEVAAVLDESGAWRSFATRYRFWESGADPAFSAELSLLRERSEESIAACLDGQAASLSPVERTALASLFRYLGVVERVRRAPPAPPVPPWLAVHARLRLAPGTALFRAPVELGPLLGGGFARPADLACSEQRLLVQRTATGTITKAINVEMERLLRIFAEPTSVRDAITAWLPEGATAEHSTQIWSILLSLLSEGTLIPDREIEELARGQNLLLRTLTAADEAAVLRVYRENHRFFQAIAGVDEPPISHVQSDVQEGPPGHESHKSFLGLALVGTGELVGVADFVDSYPKQGEGCFGLLLLSERSHGRGLGKEAATLVEGWALRRHGVRRVTLGVELANEPAGRFWRRQGYEPTGERFMTSALGRDNEAEVLVKVLAPEGP